MIGREIDALDGGQLVRFVRALGQHRYVAGRLHLVHAFVVEAACAATGAGEVDPALAEASAWASAVLDDPDIDRASRDERLCRPATDAELLAVLGAFWNDDERRERASLALAERLVEIGEGAPDLDRLPFDESSEDDIFPLLIDAGWELLPLSALDAERHKGAIAAFGDALAFEVAKFEEASVEPPLVSLYELPALGAIELLGALDSEGSLRTPFVLWTSGHESYVDYLLRGILRAAKIEA